MWLAMNAHIKYDSSSIDADTTAEITDTLTGKLEQQLHAHNDIWAVL